MTFFGSNHEVTVSHFIPNNFNRDDVIYPPLKVIRSSI